MHMVISQLSLVKLFFFRLYYFSICLLPLVMMKKVSCEMKIFFINDELIELFFFHTVYVSVFVCTWS